MPATVHVKRRLTDASSMAKLEFTPQGPWWFPEKGTPFLSDQFAVHSKANALALRDLSPVGDDDLPQELSIVYEADKSFTIQVYALSSPDKWITKRNADPSLSYEYMRSLLLTLGMRIRLEHLRINETLRNTALMTQNVTLTTPYQFDNYNSSNSQPVTMLQGYVNILTAQNQGEPPNRASCARETLMAIGNSQDFRSRVQYTSIPNATDVAKQPNGIARLLENMIGLPAGALRTHDATYNLGTVSAPNYKKFIGSDFAIGYVEQLGLMAATLGVGWKWDALPDETSITSKVQATRGAMQGEELVCIAAVQPQIVRPELGFLIKNCVNTSNYGGFLD